jgi:putative ABC transport system ATP-binding protein
VATIALRNVSLTVNQSEFVAIIGPSGSGKSTLLNMLGALDLPTSGQVLIDGQDVTLLNNIQLARYRNRKIGFVFQSYNLVQRMNALGNVILPLALRGASSLERKRKAIETLNLVGLGNKLNHRPTQLSGGEQQRVAIARALVTEPAIILGDEPSGNLDTVNTAVLIELFQKLNREKGMTIIIITHNSEIANVANRIITIRDGQITSEMGNAKETLRFDNKSKEE